MTLETSNELPNIFQGSDILPIQYNDLFRRGTSSDAERRLLFALLEDGIRCYLRYRDAERNSPQRLEFLEASNWLNSENDDGPFAFMNQSEPSCIHPSHLTAAV